MLLMFEVDPISQCRDVSCVSSISCSMELWSSDLTNPPHMMSQNYMETENKVRMKYT